MQFPACGMPEDHDANSGQRVGADATPRETATVRLSKL
jgi:hypothetical protein